MPRACTALRCTDCCFGVSSFADAAWAADVDYLFFRNAFPDATRLAPKLEPRRGATAYACQCTWRSLAAPLASSADGALHWYCAGHADDA